MPQHTTRGHSWAKRTTIEPEPNYVIIKPPKETRPIDQWMSKSQPTMERSSAASYTESKHSKNKSPATKNHTTGKSVPKEKAATAEETPLKRGATGKREPTPKHSKVKKQPTNEPLTDKSQPATKASKVKDQATIEVPIIMTQPTVPFQISLKIIRIPHDWDPHDWDKTPMKAVTVPLSKRLPSPPLGVGSVRTEASVDTEELESWLGHVPQIWSLDLQKNYWKHRTLLADMTTTDLSKLSPQELDTMVTPDNFLYVCKNPELPLPVNQFLKYHFRQNLYGDAFFFRWNPQQWRTDGRAELLDTEEDFIRSVYQGKYAMKLLHYLVGGRMIERHGGE